ncbi:MAG: ABC transporter substrate-binding protein, partial [Thermodesulfobacteriota bacterium]|nr:ABC transporter substrate-binding protein [Thermodesulfobacteriota bacterium]
MRDLRKTLSMTVLGFICVIVTASSGYAEEVRGVTSDTIKIGGMVDMTGPLAETYKILIDGLKVYFGNVNDRGGVHGRKIKHILEDDRYSIPMALSAYKKLVFKDKVMALVPGASGLGHTHAIIPLAEKHKMPLIAGTNNVKYYKPARRYVFALLPFYEDQVKLIFEYIYKDLKAKNPKIAVAYPDVGSGKVTLETSKKLAKLYGAGLVSETVISVMAGDFSSQIINLRRLKPDYVIIHGYPSNTMAFLRTARRFRFSSTFIVIQYGAVEETVRMSGKAARNMIGINCFSSWDDDSPGMVKLKRMTLKYLPDSRSQGRNFTQGWFGAMLVHEGLKNAGRDLDGETFVEGLQKI